MDTAKLSIIVPAYNESHRLVRSLEILRDYAAKNPGIEVVVVDDGSRDGTADLVRNFPPGPMTLRVMRHEVNRGKGHCVRTGMLAATGEVLLMCDADMSTPIEEVEKLLPHLAAGFGVVIASRDMPDSLLDPPQGLLRRVLTTLFRLMRGSILLPDIRDTQCGFKAFTRPVAQQVFKEQTAEGFAFDLEILGLARALGHRIREVGVTWRNDPRSTLKVWRDGPKMLIEMVKIRRRLASFRPTPYQPPIEEKP